jgi:predicted nucleotide-binding protein
MTVPRLRPTRKSADHFFHALREAQRPNFEEADRQLQEDPFGPLFSDYGLAVDEFRRDGRLPSSHAGIRAFAIRGSNRYAKDLPIDDYGQTTFALLEQTDLQSVTLRYSCVPLGILSLDIIFDDRGATIELDSWMAYVPGERITDDEIEDLVLRCFERGGTDSDAIATNSSADAFRVFIGHGNDNQWQRLRSQLTDEHGFLTEAFEGESRAGMLISNILETMVSRSSVALLVFAASDEQKDGSFHGRQNVMHELGYCQARLGWDRSIILREEGVVLPSNLDGTQYIPFRKGDIDGAMGKVVGALRKLHTVTTR